MDRILKGQILRVQTMDLTPRVQDFCNRLHIHRLHIHHPHSHQCIHRLQNHLLRIALHRRPHRQHLKNKKTFPLTIQRHLAPTSDVAQVLGHLPLPRPLSRPHLLLNTKNNSLCLT